MTPEQLEAKASAEARIRAVNFGFDYRVRISIRRDFLEAHGILEDWCKVRGIAPEDLGEADHIALIQAMLLGLID